jgi:uncharacterized membrane protein
MVHQVSNHHHIHRVLEEVPVDLVLMLVMLVMLVVLVVVIVPHHTNHQASEQEELEELLVVLVVLVVLMLLLLLSTMPIRTKMVVLIQTNLNNSIKVVYKENKLCFLFSHIFLYTLFLTYSNSYSRVRNLFILISIL